MRLKEVEPDAAGDRASIFIILLSLFREMVKNAIARWIFENSLPCPLNVWVLGKTICCLAGSLVDADTLLQAIDWLELEDAASPDPPPDWHERFLVLGDAGQDEEWMVRFFVPNRDGSINGYGLAAYPGRRIGTNTISTAMTTDTIVNSRSEFARDNWDLLEASDWTTYIYSTDRDRGYPTLAVFTPITELQLNRQSIADSLDVPLLSGYSTEISVPRVAKIEEAISTGKNQFFRYSYRFEGLTFNFQSEIILLSPDEVAVRIYNDEFAKQYWTNRVKSGTAKPVARIFS